MRRPDGGPVDKDTIGRWGERLAVQWLRRHGRKVLYQNYRAPQGGEVDIVARHRDTLTFVEVKTRTSDALGRPGEAVTAAKERLVMRGANAWLKLLRHGVPKVRCDVVEIVLREGERADIKVVEGAFRLQK